MSDASAWIQTVSGGRFYPLAPRAQDVRIEDIAHALSLVCRYTGHCSEFYSVGQHSLMVASLVPPEDQLWALLHDASEAYIADVARPIKRTDAFSPYRAMEKGIMEAVCGAFDLPLEEPASVKHADLVSLATEARDLMPNREWELWDWLPAPMADQIVIRSPAFVRATFLRLFRDLTAGPGRAA